MQPDPFKSDRVIFFLDTREQSNHQWNLECRHRVYIRISVPQLDRKNCNLLLRCFDRSEFRRYLILSMYRISLWRSPFEWKWLIANDGTQMRPHKFRRSRAMKTNGSGHKFQQHARKIANVDNVADGYINSKLTHFCAFTFTVPHQCHQCTSGRTCGRRARE